MIQKKPIILIVSIILVLSICLSACGNKSTVQVETPSEQTIQESTIKEPTIQDSSIPATLDGNEVKAVIDDGGHVTVSINDEDIKIEDLWEKGYDATYIEGQVIIETRKEDNGNGEGEVTTEPAIREDPKDPAIIRAEGPRESIGIADAGTFYSGDYDPLPVIEPGASLEEAEDVINKYMFYLYGLRYLEGELTSDYLTRGAKTHIVEKDGKYGLVIDAWRHTYASNAAENIYLNAVLSTLYYLCGDKEVASALWNWFDAIVVSGTANSDDYGFHDIVPGQTLSDGSYAATIGMNNTTIECIFTGTDTTFYFS